MDIIQGPVVVEPATNRSVSQSQPIQALAGLAPEMDDVAVRQAIANAEANNLDPQTLTLEDFAQGQNQTPSAAQPATLEVPQKFLKPDGAVDVDKLVASTKQLNEAVQKKEEAVAKTVDDYVREYTDLEKKFSSTPNPEKLAANLPSPPVQQAPNPPVAPQPFEDIVRRDYQQDPLLTTTRLIEIALQQRLAPFEQKEKTDNVRSNIQGLAEKDPRVLRPDVFAAINAKIASDPEIASRKNPHKAAWLEVKEEMRLGESSTTLTPPSRLSPVLGGGTPPSAPSSSVQTPQNVLSNLNQLDLRDKRQEALGDEAIRQALMGHRG